jgi:excisionase family DNA binding protein
MEELTMTLPEELVELVAERPAEIVAGRRLHEPEPWISVPEAAKHLSAPRSRIYSLVESGRIPHARDGTKLLFRRSELDRWLVENGGGKRP